MVDIRGGYLPVYEGEVPEDQEIIKVNSKNLDIVERYIAFHYEDFDYNFRTDDGSDHDKKVMEIKIERAVCEVLDLSPNNPLVPKYVEAVLKQLKKGVVFEDARRPRVSGAVMGGARRNHLRGSKGGGI